MWECCLCHLYNPCVLMVVCKDLIGQKDKTPQDTLFSVSRIIKPSNNFLQAAGKNNEELYKSKIIYSDDNYYPEVQKSWRHFGTKQNHLRKRNKDFHFIIISTKMNIVI